MNGRKCHLGIVNSPNGQPACLRRCLEPLRVTSTKPARPRRADEIVIACGVRRASLAPAKRDGDGARAERLARGREIGPLEVCGVLWTSASLSSIAHQSDARATSTASVQRYQRRRGLCVNVRSCVVPRMQPAPSPRPLPSPLPPSHLCAAPRHGDCCRPQHAVLHSMQYSTHVL